MFKYIAAIGVSISISTAALADEPVSTMTPTAAIEFINSTIKNWTSKDIGGYVLRHIKAHRDFHPTISMSYHDTDTQNYRLEIAKSVSNVELEYMCSSVEIWLSHVNEQDDGRKNYFSSRICISDSMVQFRGLTSHSPVL